MKKAIIYGDSMDNDFKIRGERMSYFYLDGNAETKNGYDCCNGNITAFGYAIRNIMFFADLKYANGGRNLCLVIPYISMGSIHGYIVLPDDLPAIEQAMRSRNNEFRMYEHEKTRLQIMYPETFNFIKQLNK